MKFLKHTILALSAAGMPVVAWAQLREVTAPAGTATGTLESSVLTLVNIFLVLVGIVASIVLIYGGVQYIISRGDEGATENAKNTILYAVIGLIVIGIAAAIVNFVIRAIAAA